MTTQDNDLAVASTEAHHTTAPSTPPSRSRGTARANEVPIASTAMRVDAWSASPTRRPSTSGAGAATVHDAGNRLRAAGWRPTHPDVLACAANAAARVNNFDEMGVR